MIGQETRITVPVIRSYKHADERFVMLTAYDYLTATAFDRAGVPMLLVGDTLGIFVQGHDTTLAVTMDAMVYHCEIVARAARRSLVIGDLPFGTYNTLEAGIQNAGRLVKDAGVQAIKLEGRQDELIKNLTQLGIPVMGHVGLTPQSVYKFGSFRKQGKTAEEGDRILQEALALEQAGVFSIVLEHIPAELAKKISQTLTIPTIGIGAGPDCDGQVLVTSDLLGLSDWQPPFAKPYVNLRAQGIEAAQRFCEDVRTRQFEVKH